MRWILASYLKQPKCIRDEPLANSDKALLARSLLIWRLLLSMVAFAAKATQILSEGLKWTSMEWPRW
jgi:hypothetical protein